MAEITRRRTRVQIIGLILGPILAIATSTLDLDPDVPFVSRMASVAVLMAVWWVTEAIPLAATSLLPVVLFPLLGIMTPAATAPLYFNSTIFLFMGGFIIALAMERWNLHKRIALLVIKTIGGSPSRLVLGFMVAAAFLSMWISNTATAVMMLPVGLSIILKMEDEFGKDSAHKFSVALMLGIAYAASTGGMATLVGTPPNLVFQRVFGLTFPEAPGIPFGSWFIMAVPIAVVMLAITWLMLTKVLYRPAANLKIDRRIIRREYDELGPVSPEERVVLAVFAVTAVLWLFRTDIALGFIDIPGWSRLLPDAVKVDDGTVAMVMALLLFFIPTRSAAAAARSATLVDTSVFPRLPWGVIILFGGGFALAKGFQVSGLAGYLGEQLIGLAKFPPLAMVASINVTMTFLTELTSNTATTQMILPVLSSLAVAIGENPLLLMIPATLSASCAFMMPVATPPNAIVFGSERVKIWEMVKAGLALNVIGIALVTLVVFLWGAVVFDFAPGAQPDWAAPAPAARQPAGMVAPDDRPPVVIGVPLPLTGDSAPTAAMMKNAFVLAAETINAEGGIDGRPLLLAFGDNEEDPDVARGVVEDLVVNARAVMLVGGFRSDPADAMVREAEARDVPFLVSTAAADRITRSNLANVFRLSPPVSEYADGLKDLWLKESRPRSVAIVHENTLFGIDGATDMLDFLQNNGIEATLVIPFPAGAGADPARLRSRLATLAQDPPDIVYMIASLDDSIALTLLIRGLGIESQLSGGALGFASPDFIAGAGLAAEGLTTASLWSGALPHPGARDFHDRYAATYAAVPDYHGAEAYAALLVAADALNRAESFSPEDVRAALERTVMDTPFGPVKFSSYDRYERQNDVRTHVLQVQDGRFRIVWPADVRTAPYRR